MHLCTFAEVGTKVAGAAKASQLTGARSGDDEPFSADDLVLDGAGVLEEERALPLADRAGDALDSDEARGSVCPGCLQELDDSVAGDVAAEALLDVDPAQCWPLSLLVVRGGLVLVHRDGRVRPGFALLGCGHRGAPFTFESVRARTYSHSAVRRRAPRSASRRPFCPSTAAVR